MRFWGNTCPPKIAKICSILACTACVWSATIIYIYTIIISSSNKRKITYLFSDAQKPQLLSTNKWILNHLKLGSPWDEIWKTWSPRGFAKNQKIPSSCVPFFWGKFHPGGSNIEDAANSKSSLQRLYLCTSRFIFWWGGDGRRRGNSQVRVNKNKRELTGEQSELFDCIHLSSEFS